MGARTIVITGGGGAIGLAIARAYASDGSNVVITDVDSSRVAAAVSDVTDLAGRVASSVVDVSTPDGVRRCVTDALETFGYVDVLVNCAAIMWRGNIFDLSVDDWRRVIDVNLGGTFLMSQAVARTMSRGGAIVNIGSINACRINENIVAYGVSKAAVDALTRALAVAFAPYGIRVNGIVGGHVPTELSRVRLDDPVEREKVVSSIPLGRLGRPIDFAKAVKYLASDEAAWITGTMLPVDGGWLNIDPTVRAGPKTAP
ncbi:MAG: SDR family NAD(P)-dependent oxidoreductase [Haloechinothrix sp.]